MSPVKQVFSIERRSIPLKIPVIQRRWVIQGKWDMRESQETLTHLPEGCALLRILRIGVCYGDLRYLAARRPPQVLKEKLPMAPFHEAVAEVMEIAEPNVSLQPGQKVVPVPNLPCTVHDFSESPPCDACAPGGPGENYCRDVRFLGSNVHGFGQSHLVHPVERCLPLPKGVPWQIAFLAEPFSVSFHAARLCPQMPNVKVLVLGAGLMGGMLILALSEMGRLPKEQLFVCDPREERVQELSHWATPWKEGQTELDAVVECAGGNASNDTVNMGLEYLKPGGFLGLLGVPNKELSLSFRPLMDKGLTLRGINRSAIEDYRSALEAMTSKAVRQHLEKQLSSTPRHARGAEDFLRACRAADQPNRDGKIYVDLPINP